MIDLGITRWSVYDSLDTEESVDLFLELAAEHNDPAYFAKALDKAAIAHEMIATAKMLGVPRESLYRAPNGDLIEFTPPEAAFGAVAPRAARSKSHAVYC